MLELKWARCSGEDWSERPTKRKAKVLMKVIGPAIEAKKTKSFVEINGSKSGSDDNNNKLPRRNNNTSNAKVSDDFNYSKGDE